MKKEKLKCPECKGLGVIGTSVGSNTWRGNTYDCEVCHGTGYILLFKGNGFPNPKTRKVKKDEVEC